MPAGLPALLALGLLLAAAGAGLLVLSRRLAAARARAGSAAARAERLEERLAASPYGCFALEAGATAGLRRLLDLGNDGVDGGDGGLAELCERFAEGDGERLREAVEALRGQGTAFALTLRAAGEGRWFEAVGRDGGAPAVWFAEVSEREAALRGAQSEGHGLRALVDSLPPAIWRRGADLALIDCNLAYADAVDRPRETALAEGVELLGERHRDVARSLARRALETGELQREEHHVVVDGSRRLLAVHEMPLGDGGLAGLALDRTELEELQGELTRHIAAHDDVLESLATAIAVYGADMRLKFYNSAYVELWGLEESFLDGEPHMEDVMEALRERRRLPEQPDFRAYKRERMNRFSTLLRQEEELMHRPDGSTLRLTTTPHPFGGVLFTYEDVTDRLTLERSFNTLIEVQRETIENLYEGVAVFGADGRLALCNQAYARLWRLPGERLGDRPHLRDLLPHMRELFPATDADWPELVERLVARATEPETRSGRMERPDGTVLVWAQVPLPDGQSLFTYLDVTDSTRVERALRERNEALETADRLKSEFIANVSYELRTPLNAIVGFAEILENEYFGELNDRQREYARAIVQSSQRLMHLINDILDLATIEAGYMSLERRELDVRELLDGVQGLGHERAHGRGIEIEVDCHDDVGRIEGDERRLKQALFNLLSNAIAFTPEGGRVTLSARGDGERLRLAVSDTGIGIPEEAQARVFNKFDQGGERSRGSGAGLGLSLVKSLIELHGGRVELESAPEAGTRVTCHLPRTPPPAEAGESEAEGNREPSAFGPPGGGDR